MEHFTTTTDARDLDCLFLATIAGCDYYEQRLILRVDGQKRSVVGRASDWPIIQRDAQIHELAALLTASERRSVEADCHVAELLSRLSAYEELFAVRPAAESPALTSSSDAAPEEPADTSAMGDRVQCDQCDKWFRPNGLSIHQAKAHTQTQRPAVVVRPSTPPVAAPPAPIALALGEAPWRCATCGSDTHARSVSDSARCIRCVVATAEQHTNGHQVAA